MSSAAPPQSSSEIGSTNEGRRSTRLQRTVPLVVLGQTRTGLSFQEKTATVSFNLHGCRYPSRHEYPIGSSVGLRVLQADGETISPVIRAFVRSIHPASSPRELLQVGVELECPANIWSISPEPQDWNRLVAGGGASSNFATAATPALEATTSQPVETVAVPPIASAFPPPIGAQMAAGTVEAASGPTTETPGTTKPEPAKETPRPERVSMTIDQLVAAMQGKLQIAADKVVRSILASQLEEAVTSAVARIDDARKAQLRQFDESAADRFDSMMRAYREEILGHLESRLGEFQMQWAEQQNGYRAQAEEISQRLEALAAEIGRNLEETRKFASKLSHEIEPQTRGKLEESLAQRTEQFERSADRISDRQLVRVMEATRMVTREAAAQLDARVAESRALMHGAAASTLDEFRRQAEVQVDLAGTETVERVRSALSALDAENRMVCDSRRRALVDDVARATEQSTEQFRSGIKAFLYSCLVAAVGAVDEHAKTTLEGLVKDANGTPRTLADAVIPPTDEEKPN